LSEDYLALIGDLRQKLELLQTAIAPQVEPAPAIAKDWLIVHNRIQNDFHAKIVNTNLELTPQNLSLQVEIDKQLKMLGVDFTMLQTSRSEANWQKRHQQASDRLASLQRYCQMHYEA
jgi:hypothetical protein